MNTINSPYQDHPGDGNGYGSGNPSKTETWMIIGFWAFCAWLFLMALDN